MVDAAGEEAMVSAGSNATIANNATSREQRTSRAEPPCHFGALRKSQSIILYSMFISPPQPLNIRHSTVLAGSSSMPASMM